MRLESICAIAASAIAVIVSVVALMLAASNHNAPAQPVTAPKEEQPAIQAQPPKEAIAETPGRMIYQQQVRGRPASGRTDATAAKRQFTVTKGTVLARWTVKGYKDATEIPCEVIYIEDAVGAIKQTLTCYGTGVTLIELPPGTYNVYGNRFQAGCQLTIYE